MAVVSFVLVAVAFIIVRTTEADLVDRVDQQLVSAGGAVGPGGGGAGFATSGAPVSPTPVYVLQLQQGQLSVVLQPNVTSEGSGPPALSVVALSLQDVDATMGRLRTVLIAAIAMVIGILGLVVFWVLRLGVRPLKRMTKTAGAIAAGDLSERVPAEAEGTEARELGDALNAMLTTIEGAFAERSASEARLRRLVDDLLLLARLDEGRPLARDSVDLGVLGVDAAADARAVAPDRVITADVAEGVTVDGDEDRLRQVVGNLVGNALVHTPAGTPVSVHVHNGGALAVVEVHDDGPGMTSDVAERAFERFSRADASRSRHAGG